MAAKALEEALERVANWPEEAQRDLAEVALEIDAELSGGIYHATVDELQGIDRGLKAAREARFASDVEVKEVFAKHRPAGRLSIRRKRLPTSTLFLTSYPRIIRVCTLPLKGEYSRSRRALAHSRRALRRSSSGRVSASCLSFVIPIKYSNGLKMT
jgi:hypothetical protein